MLPLQGAQVQSLIEELRSCKPRGAAKKTKKKRKEKEILLNLLLILKDRNI